MSQCGAIDCNHNNLRETCSFFKLPTEPKVRAKWLRLLRRDPDNIPKVLKICSCHFIDGKKENGPELFSFNIEKKFPPHYLSPEKKTRRKLHFPSSLQGEPSISPEFADDSYSGENICGEQAEQRTREQEQIAEVEEMCSVVTNTETVDLNQPSTSKTFATSVLSPATLEAENYFLKKKLETLQQTISEKLSYETIRSNNKLVVLYTGLPDSKIFDTLYDLLSDLDIKYYFEHRVEKISRQDQLLMTLMKLRQNFPHEDLAFRFGVSSSTVSNVVITWVHVLYEVLYKQLMTAVPSRQKNKSCLPSSFNNFTNCRIILDCTEVYTMVPRKSMKNQKLTFSTYKHRNTLKALLGVAPNGVITFLSDLYPGSVSDKVIVEKSGIINHLQTGDLVIADKGFLIGDILPPGVNLNLPPFLQSSQFTKEQIQFTESIAKARIHVERAIRRMKAYKILNLIPSTMRKFADIIFKAIGALTNLHYPLIKEVETLYDDYIIE